MIGNLADLPWINPLCQRFDGLLQQSRLPHALLIDGAPGWGQADLAAWLTRRLLELPESQALERIPELAHPNLRWVEPDGANIPVDLVRAATYFATTTAQGNGVKVLVINQAHFLQVAAANALLKTLEEPVPNTYIVLATGYAARLLPTVRSRCQRFTLRGAEGEAQRWLATQSDGLEPKAAESLAALLFEYGGAPLQAAKAQEEGALPLAPVLAKALGSRNAGSMAADVLGLMPPNSQPADLSLRWLRYVVAQAGGANYFSALNGCPERRLLDFARELLAIQRQLLASNSVNTKSQFERLLVLWRGLAVAG